MTDKRVWFITGAGRGMGVDIARAALAAGSAIHLSWRPEHVHYFDAASGARRDDVRMPADGKIGLVQSFA